MTTHRHAFLLGSILATTLPMTTHDTAHAQAENPAVVRSYARTQKPPLHGKHWMAITGKPLELRARLPDEMRTLLG